MTGPTIVTPELLRAWPLPDPGTDKESRGVVLVVGGSRRTPGAVILAGEASLRVGGGKLQVATAETVFTEVGLALPEAMVCGLAEDDAGDIAATAADEVVGLAGGAGAVLLGPGLLSPDSAGRLLADVVPHLDGPVVIDALGTAYVTEHPDGLAHLDGRAVLTMNPHELACTLRVDDEVVDGDPAGASVRLAERADAVVLCGGPTKVVASPKGETWEVRDGNPGLGIAGSGDVQAGFVAGLLARGAEPAQAAVWAGHLHAVAGDRLAKRVGPVGFLAREIPAEAPALLAARDPGSG